MSDPIELELRLDAPPEAVFPYLTQSERYARWQGVRAELDARPGGVFRVWMDDERVASGSFVEVEPDRRVVFTWGWEGNSDVPPGSTTVQIDIEPDGRGTRLTLRHSGLPNDASTTLHEEGWRFFTARLAAVASGGS